MNHFVVVRELDGDNLMDTFCQSVIQCIDFNFT